MWHVKGLARVEMILSCDYQFLLCKGVLFGLARVVLRTPTTLETLLFVVGDEAIVLLFDSQRRHKKIAAGE